MIRFLHTADWHLGKFLHQHNLLEDQKQVLDQLLNLIQGQSIDFLIIAGDIYDRSIPPAEATSLLGSFLSRLQDELGIPVLIIAGNHDSPVRLGFGHRLLEKSAVHLRSLPEHISLPVNLDIRGQKVQLWGLPYLQKGDLELEESQESVWEKAIQIIHSAQDPQAHQILAAHLFAAGAKESDSERPLVGGIGQVEISLLEGFDYVALGHLHRPQHMGANVYYSGSPLAYSFSEAGDEKSWTLVELSHKGLQIQRLPIQPPRPVTRLQGALQDFLEEGDRWQAVQDHYLEIQLTSSDLVPGMMNRLRRRFPYLLSLRQDDQVQLSKVLDREVVERDSRDILEDFQDFWKFHYEQEPDPDTSALFMEYLQEANRETD